MEYEKMQKEMEEALNEVDAVVEAPAKKPKESVTLKLFRFFISEDITDVGEFLWKDVIAPNVREGVKNSIMDLLGYDSGLYSSRKGKPTNYSSMYKGKITTSRVDDEDDEEDILRTKTSPYTTSDRVKAETVMKAVENRMATKGRLTVAEWLKITGQLKYFDVDWTDHCTGWTEEDDIRIVRSMGKYKVILPRPVGLDR